MVRGVNVSNSHRCGLKSRGIGGIESLAECYDENDPEECREVAEGVGLEFVGKGKSRHVYALPGGYNTGSESCVLKFSTGYGGDVQNERELESWKEYGPTNNLAAIRDHGDGWILMKRVDGEPDMEQIREWQDETFNRGYRCSDLKTKNFGVNTLDDAVLVDYGDGCRDV